MSRRPPPRLASLVLVVALAGCGLLTAPKTIQTQFFVLNAVAPATGARADISIGLGPVTIPSYLDRPAMARRVDEYQIAYDPSLRWAEPLQDNFQRVVAANLVQLIGPQRILLYPWVRSAALDVFVTVAVARFEQQPDGSLLLEARWVVRDRADVLLAVEVTRFTRPGGTPEANAAALSALVGDLSQAIAAAIPTSVSR
jgi:uncharacterized lipoprotein YmbA